MTLVERPRSGRARRLWVALGGVWIVISSGNAKVAVWLRASLTDLGAGTKTAAGDGYFTGVSR